MPPHPKRTSLSQKRGPSTVKKSVQSDNGSAANGNQSKPSSPPQTSVGGERTVKKLRLSKALTIPEGTTVSDACRRMAARRVDAVLLTDANALLSGIITDKDIATRVIAEGLRPEQTVVSKIMTRNPVFVTSDTLAIEALQKMVQAIQHLPVAENHSEMSAMMQSDGAETAKQSYPSLGLGNSFAFKFEDLKGRMHRFNCGTESLEELISVVVKRLGSSDDQGHPQLLYEDDEGDKILLTTDGDLISAVGQARSTGQKVLNCIWSFSVQACKLARRQGQLPWKRGWLSMNTGILASATVLTSIGVLVYLKRSQL
ncbi:LOW QUALITY PROTEIN: CBS domain-containing protein CBSCBSPB3-like [Carica papaya]|uniref:LOW QUALITY PROTEIN: CBS domain-containing protein CBSCBSPB3-like n=1 Tax=Carica papaya TaxID=3649 RepID=UPI000B8D0240|nr:LOW QUALITY PROTEIN: CBS domain-containing protein CBSCBSPB3-like [Carica papaya]